MDPKEPLPLNETQSQKSDVAWSDHLKLHKSGLPASLLLSLYFLLLFGLTIPIYLLRRRIRARWRRFIRRNAKREDLVMEEGRFLSGNGRVLFTTPLSSGPPSPDQENTNGFQTAAQSIRRAVSRVSLGSSASNSVRAKPQGGSPRSESFPATFPIFPQNLTSSGPGSSNTLNGNVAVDAQSLSSSHPLSALSLSRSSSQVSLIPRQNASRSGSGTLTPQTEKFNNG